MSAPSVTWAAAERLAPRLSERDWQIVRSLVAARVLTGAQIGRLHFHDLSAATRDRTRRRVLARLAEWQVVTPLDRRIGGVRAGSDGLVFAIGPTGTRLADLSVRAEGARIRKPWTPSPLFLAHSVAVAELFVDLTERARRRGFALARFDAEPACWWPDGKGSVLKPDAYAVLAAPGFDEHLWLEVDRGTESLPTLRRKLTSYVQFWRRGEVGPGGVMPRVAVVVPSEARRDAVLRIVAGLDNTGQLFIVETDAASRLEQLVAVNGQSP